jgi:hydrogenase maturation protease
MTILIGIGNALRRDDGVAHRVLELLGPFRNAVTRSCLQLAPEMAEDIAPAETVVFIDADVNPGLPSLELLTRARSLSAGLTHSVSPCRLVTLARNLYGFHGVAYLCRVPGVDFSEGEGLSPEAESNANSAAGLLRGLQF